MKDSTILFTIIFSFFTCFLSGQEYIQITGAGDCPPDTVYFSTNTDSLDISSLTDGVLYKIYRNDSLIRDLPAINNNPVSWIFNIAGNYRIELVSAGDQSLIYARTRFTVRQRLNSDFDYEVITDPLEINFFPTDTIRDTINNYSFVWTISQGTLQINQSPVLFAASDSIEEASYLYTFADTGTYTVTLQTQRNITRCASSNSRTIIVQPEPVPPDTSGIIPIANYFVPEAHNYFIIDPNDQSVVLSFKIYSRTGVLVFTAESEVIYWDGRNSSGQELSTGVYYYVLNAIQGDIGNTKPYGFIHLFRE